MKTRTRAALTALPAIVELARTRYTNDTPDSSESAHAKPTSKPPMPMGPVSDIDEAFKALADIVWNVQRRTPTAAPQPYWGAVCAYLAAHLDAGAAAAGPGHLYAWEETINASFDQLSRHAIDEDRDWWLLPGRWMCPFEAVDPDSGIVLEPITDGRTGELIQSICGGILLESRTERVIRCRTCKRRWEGDLEYEQLGRQLGVETIITLQQAAVLAKVTERTIRNWITREWLPVIRNPLTPKDVFVDRRDLAIIAARGA